MSIRSTAALRTLASTGLVLLVAACASTRPTASPEVARTEVFEAEQRWWRAVSRGDVDHALVRFSNDTVFEAPDGAVIRGRVALGERLRRDFQDHLDVLGVPEHVHVDSPELVVVTGTGQWTISSEQKGPTTVRYIDTWRWTGSSWRLVSVAAAPISESSAGSALVRQVLDAWSSGDWAKLQPLLAPGYRARSAKTGEGSDLKQRFDSFHRSWTRARFEIEEQFAVGERIVTRIAATLTDAKTGRIVRYSGLDVSRVVDGQLTEHWDSWEEARGQQATPEPLPEGSGSEKPAGSSAPSAAKDSLGQAQVAATRIAAD